MQSFVDDLLGSRDRSLLWSATLLEGAHFKRSVIRRGFAEDFVTWYGSLMLPRHVWLLEMSVVYSDQWSDAVNAGAPRQILGEFLMDSSAPEPEPRCLAFRIGPVGYDYRAVPDSEEPAIDISAQSAALDYRAYERER
jgi:hypothetical protein